MKIKYLKQAPQGMPGDVAEVPDLQANILIKLKFAEAVGDQPSIKYLQNLNDTPVVDDFGNLVVVQGIVVSADNLVKEQIHETEPSKPKTTRARKVK